MIITKSEPFTAEDIVKLKQEFEVYIKTVIDIEKKECSAGMNRHFEGEQLLLETGSKQSNLWGVEELTWKQKRLTLIPS